jgi:hypothetical protein
MTLEIRLLRFSTGQPHPLAEQPIIFITTKSLLLGHCNVLIEIVGDFLALLVTFPWAQNEHEDMFFLVRWKKGDAHCVSASNYGPTRIAHVVCCMGSFDPPNGEPTHTSVFFLKTLS